MIWYLCNVYVHILATVFWIGYALFWTITAYSLQQRYTPPESRRFFGMIKHTAWPPVGIPAPYRVPFPGLGWAALSVLTVTGIFMLASRGITLQQVTSGALFVSATGRILALKLLLVIALLIWQLVLTYRPVAWTIYPHIGGALFVVVLSVLLVH
jgi:uncharacterized membrane protein